MGLRGTTRSFGSSPMGEGNGHYLAAVREEAETVLNRKNLLGTEEAEVKP